MYCYCESDLMKLCKSVLRVMKRIGLFVWALILFGIALALACLLLYIIGVTIFGWLYIINPILPVIVGAAVLLGFIFPTTSR